MKLKLKTLQSTFLEVDVEEDDTIATVKEKVEAAHGIPVAQQNLVCSGKVMDLAKTCKDYELVCERFYL
jgi:hypothetical protein